MVTAVDMSSAELIPYEVFKYGSMIDAVNPQY